MEMSDQKIMPSQVTKPIQLLAAWLVGLILTNGAFLSAANIISKPDWAPGLLVVASVANVPAFLFLIFYLQTKFRAELQEDTYYSKHLEAITGQVKEVANSDAGLYGEISSMQIATKVQFELIAGALEGLTKRIDQMGEGSPAMSFNPELPPTTKTIVQIEAQQAKSLVRVGVNTLMPGFKEIAKQLIAADFSIVQYFGVAGKNDAPEYLTVSYGAGVNKESLKAVYKILKPYGFNYIDWDDKAKGITKLANLWVGSYITPEHSTRASVEMDQSIEDMLFSDEVSIEQLSEYIRAIRNVSKVNV
jgi:ribosomal protein L9